MDDRTFWDAAASSPNLRNEWICSSAITDDECRAAIFPHLLAGATLDLGCGIGRLTTDCGCDVSPGMLARARAGPEYRLGDGRAIPWPDDSFAGVFSMGMFQHVPDDVKAGYCAEVARVLRPAGRFRLQLVIGPEQIPFSYQTTVAAVLEMLDAAALRVLDAELGRLEPQWLWVTAEPLDVTERLD